MKISLIITLLRTTDTVRYFNNHNRLSFYNTVTIKNVQYELNTSAYLI